MSAIKKQFIVLITIFISFLNAYGIEKDAILISADDAVKLIGAEHVVFVSADSIDIYRQGHIKESVWMYAYDLHDSNILGEMLCSPLFSCSSKASNYIGSKGINNDSLVIVYDNYSGINATGVYIYLKSYGHKSVRILNGGLGAISKLDPNKKIYDSIYTESMLDENQDITIKQEFTERLNDVERNLLILKGEEEKIIPKLYTIDKINLDYSNIASKNEVMLAMEDILKNGEKSDYVIIDTRSMNEIIGEKIVDDVARGGHIPGALFIESKRVVDEKNRLSFKSIEELSNLFASYNITRDKTIYAYSHVGSRRASQIITALKIAGYKNVKVYTGSWDEWGNDLSLPIKR